MPSSTNTGHIGLKILLSLAFVAGYLPSFSSPAWGQAGAKLNGEVYFDGNVAQDFPVSLYSPDQVLQTQTDKAGRFEFSGLPPGTYDLLASFLGVEGTIYGIRIEDKDVGPLTVLAKEVEFVPLMFSDCGRKFWASYKQDSVAKGGHLAGLLLVYPDVPNKILAKIRIDLTPADGSRRRISQHADENGKFEFENAPPGRYSLLAHYRGYWAVQSTIWITRKNTATVKIILYRHGHPAICE